MLTSIVIPYMHNQWRQRLLMSCLKTLPTENTEICIVELGDEPGLSPSELGHRSPIKYKFVKTERAFNRAWAINIGARHLSEGEMLVLSDGDLLFPVDVSKVWSQTNTPAVAWKRLHRLDKKRTERYLDSPTFSEPCTEQAFSVFSPPSTDSACGGVNVIPRDIFFETAGMVEAFEGWGGEDNATWARLIAYGYPFRFLDCDICHLWHPSRAQYGQERAYVCWMNTWSKEDWVHNTNHGHWGSLDGPCTTINKNAYLRHYNRNGTMIKGRALLASISNDLGLDYIHRGMYKEAIEELKQSINVEPNLASAHMNLAIAYTKAGVFEKALSEYDKALHIDPDYGHAHYNLAILCLKTGQHQRAIAHCDQALDLGVNVHPHVMTSLDPYRRSDQNEPR